MNMFNKKEYYQKNRKGRTEYQKEYRKNNPEKMKEYSKKYRENSSNKIIRYSKQYYKKNRERILKYNKQYRKDNLEKMKKCQKQWYENNIEKIKKQCIKFWLKKYKIDLKFRLNELMSGAIRRSLKGNKNGKHWENLVGYTLNDLIKRLKKTMPKKYDWQDYLQGKLHIDHIIPKSVFNFTNPEHIDFKRCWALKNLRLLPAKENLTKHNKLYKPFQPSLLF